MAPSHPEIIHATHPFGERCQAIVRPRRARNLLFDVRQTVCFLVENFPVLDNHHACSGDIRMVIFVEYAINRWSIALGSCATKRERKRKRHKDKDTPGNMHKGSFYIQYGL